MPTTSPFMERPVPRILEGQKVLVTGASSGIGKSVAMAMASAGADVCVNYPVEAEMGKALEEVEEIRAHGGHAWAHQCDVSKESEVVAMFERIRKEMGTVDIVVANAGIQRDAPIEAMTLDQWNQVMGVNLTGQFLTCREAVREFKRRGFHPVSRALGKIICMSSVHEVIPWGGHVNYAASKGGVMLMMKSIAQEVAPAKIRVLSIAPGAIRTPINRDAWETPEAYGNLLKLIPSKRIGETEDIARTAVWLASDEADYITGTTIFVDGGMTLYPGFEAGG
ncbi:MAG: SDR family oxidoreductase [Gemmatimonadales bacterium]